jgi:hypothetical protein
VRINKLYSPWSDFWGPQIQKKYGFERYTGCMSDRRNPVVVFGCYGGGVKRAITKMKGLVVIIWSGGDSVRLHEEPEFIEYCKLNKHRVFHIAHSHWIQVDLKHWGLDYIDKVILPADLSGFKFEPHEGKSVYHYGTHQRKWYYGTHILEKLEQKWRGNPRIYKTVQDSFSRDDLYRIYKDSFVGVRLTEHDNMAISVIEMGLMGRRSIFNGDVPCAIPYPCHPYDRYEPRTKVEWVWQDDSLVDIVGDMILNMYRAPDKLLAQEMREFVYDDEKWLNTKFYE